MPTILEIKEILRRHLGQSPGHSAFSVWFPTRLSLHLGVGRAGFEPGATRLCSAFFSVSSRGLWALHLHQWLHDASREAYHLGYMREDVYILAHGFLPFFPFIFMTDAVLVQRN